MAEEKALSPKQIDANIIKVWRLKRLIAVIFFALLTVAWVVVSSVLELDVVIIWGIAGGLLAVCILFIIAYIIGTKIEYRQWSYLLSEDKVEIHHGIFFRHHTVIPIIRIQHITKEQGPIYRRYQLYQVNIFLASGNVNIIGLNEAEAQYICDTLNKRLTERIKAQEEAEVQ